MIVGFSSLLPFASFFFCCLPHRFDVAADCVFGGAVRRGKGCGGVDLSGNIERAIKIDDIQLLAHWHTLARLALMRNHPLDCFRIGGLRAKVRKSRPHCAMGNRET